MEVLVRYFSKKNIVSLCLVALFLCFCIPAFPQNFDGQGDGDVEDSSVALFKGLEAYRNQDWPGAALMLKDAISNGNGDSDNLWYMMITSEIYAGYYDSAVKDCKSFESLFPNSDMMQELLYQKGRALHLMGKNAEAVTILSNFCTENKGKPMYVSALFWLAECFYDECDYTVAQNIYSMIVSDFPSDSKSVESAFRLEDIQRGERERKLLYLLKMTGEEYLSLREDYQRLLDSKNPVLDGDDVKLLFEVLDAIEKRCKDLGVEESKINHLRSSLRNAFKDY